MLDINKPVQTRDGKPARILCTDKKGNLPILALFGEYDRVGVYTMYGDFADNLGLEHPLDLINVPEKHVRYVDMYIDFDGERCFTISNKPTPKSECDACVKVYVSEGQFDE